MGSLSRSTFCSTPILRQSRVFQSHGELQAPSVRTGREGILTALWAILSLKIIMSGSFQEKGNTHLDTVSAASALELSRIGKQLPSSPDG